MLFTRLIANLRQLAAPSPEDPLLGLLPTDQLRRVLERERARTDRTGENLSLLTFTPRKQDLETLVCLVKILRARLRCTDDLGWLGAQQLGVVLPGTPAAGAWRVAEDVCLRFPQHLPPPLCTVYAYPWSGMEGGAGANGTANHGPRSSVLALDTLFLQPTPLWKRGVDVVGASIGLVLLLPVFGVIALAIKLSSRGPVFFKQLRSGRGGKPFVIYKFRSMVLDAEVQKSKLVTRNEQDGPAFKIKNDPRVTAVGRFLRNTSLDELPQLWNILKGEMCLVGPRPLPCAETQACSGWLRRRLDVTPGLTCIWQVCGRSTVPFADWVRMDLQYIRSLSPHQDLKLLFMTVPAIIVGKGPH